MVRSHHQIRCSMSFVKPIIDQTEVKDMTLPKTPGSHISA
ncbi:predicted protein [Brucella sp. 83/13]|nr:predicted protein [Brucella sp. 83/13]